MKQSQAFTQRFLLLITPLFASSILAISPSQAATFASSDANVEFTNFSPIPDDISKTLNTNTITNVAKNSVVQAMAEAFASFPENLSGGSNSSSSIAFGQRNGSPDPDSFYSGLAQSQASLIGNFDVQAGTKLSFDFTATLNQKASATDLQENAFSSGDISWVLLNTADNSTVERFNLAGNLVTPGVGDFFSIQKSDNVTLNTPTQDNSFGGNQKFITSVVQGSLQRFFPQETKLALVEVKSTQARVSTVPEPSTSMALIFCVGTISLVFKGRRQANQTL